MAPEGERPYGDPADWPLHEEIRAARRRLRSARGWPERRDILEEIGRLVRRRNAIMYSDLDVFEATGEGIVA